MKLWIFFLDDTTGARVGVADSAITKIKSGWSKHRDLAPLLASRGLALGAKGRLHSACVRSLLLYVREIWPVHEEDVIRLDRNDARILRRMYNVRIEDKISVEEHWTRLKLKNMAKCLQDRRLGSSRQNGKGCLSSKCRTFQG